MEIRDYESGRELSDVSIVLSLDEATELHQFLGRLIEAPELKRAHISEFKSGLLDRELTISLDRKAQIA